MLAKQSMHRSNYTHLTASLHRISLLRLLQHSQQSINIESLYVDLCNIFAYKKVLQTLTNMVISCRLHCLIKRFQMVIKHSMLRSHPYHSRVSLVCAFNLNSRLFSLSAVALTNWKMMKKASADEIEISTLSSLFILSAQDQAQVHVDLRQLLRLFCCATN